MGVHACRQQAVRQASMLAIKAQFCDRGKVVVEQKKIMCLFPWGRFFAVRLGRPCSDQSEPRRACVQACSEGF
ncbi:hypothetical protein D3C78_1557720 [compost metagenome]